MNAKYGAFLTALAAALLGVAALPQFSAEYQTVLFSRLSPAEKLGQLASGAVSLPPSVRSERIVLDACESSLRSPLGQFQPQEVRDALWANCAALGQSAVARAPVSSLAHLVVAISARSDAEFSSALALSQATGPFEGSLAQRRFALVLARPAKLTPQTLAVAAADVTTLVQTSAGRTLVVQGYVAYPELRDTITSGVEGAPSSAQRQFLAAVRASGG